MKRKTIIIITAIILVLLVTTTALSLAGMIDFSETGKMVRNINQHGSDKVIVTINGKYTITQKQLDISKITSSASFNANKKHIQESTDFTTEEKEKWLSTNNREIGR